MDYFKDAKILDYFLASVNSGRSLTPLMSCAALFNSQAGKLDLHFAQFVYRPDYVMNFATSPQEFLTVLANRQTAVECLYPLYIGHQLSKDYNQAFSRRDNCTMSPQLIGVARLNMNEVNSIVQIGDNITEDKPIYFLVLGKQGSTQRVIILSVDITQEISVVTNTEVEGFAALQKLKDGETYVKVLSAQASELNNGQARILFQTSHGRLICQTVSFNKDGQIIS